MADTFLKPGDLVLHKGQTRIFHYAYGGTMAVISITEQGRKSSVPLDAIAFRSRPLRAVRRELLRLEGGPR